MTPSSPLALHSIGEWETTTKMKKCSLYRKSLSALDDKEIEKEVINAGSDSACS